MIPSKKLVAVVLSGGAGTRLWPASREGHPKPFLKLADEETLIEKTYRRVKSLKCPILTVTNNSYYFASKSAIDKIQADTSFLLEPSSRNTAPAISIATRLINEKYGPDCFVLIVPADHLIPDLDSFVTLVNNGLELAAEEYLVTFGIKPTAPETGFGYIEQGDPLNKGFRAARFVEKPDLNTAQSYYESDKYFWNSGMFCFRASTFLKELKKVSPFINETVDLCWSAILPSQHKVATAIPDKLFDSIPDISIDYAVMERSDRVAVVPTDIGWNDIGSWTAVRNLINPNSDQNRVIGDAEFIDSTDNFIFSKDRLVAAVGVSDLLIIDTNDALLVAHADKAQDVKKLVEKLRSRDHSSLKFHRTVIRPWGSYTILGEGAGFKIKRIEVDPGASLSLQMHNHRSEHWVVVDGVAKITNGEVENFIRANESTYIPAGQLHRLENPEDKPCIIIEVQCGDYLGEDDIVRVDDKYGR